MSPTLEQARALDALARHGTLARAAASLGKRHSALVYSLRQLEQTTELELLDRTGYRIRLTAAGERVLASCRRLLGALADLETECHAIKTGWEPNLAVVFDGIFPAARILEQVKVLSTRGASTRVEVVAEFLSGVEAGFFARAADLMISVLPPRDETLVGLKLPPLVVWLVAERTHPLTKKRRVTPHELAPFPLLTVRGSDPRLRLPTTGLESTIQLNDFHSKREAILAGMGYGWLPHDLAADGLRKGALVKVPFSGGFRHELHPHAYRRPGRAPGRAAALVLEGLRKSARTRSHDV